MHVCVPVQVCAGLRVLPVSTHLCVCEYTCELQVQVPVGECVCVLKAFARREYYLMVVSLLKYFSVTLYTCYHIWW